MAVQENSIGVILEYTVLDDDGLPLDISSATTMKLIFKKPAGDTYIRDAAFASDGVDGKLTYTTIDGDLTPAGNWKVQAYIIMTGLNGKTVPDVFDVGANL